ncbi:MAG: PrsW family intramembrane metalloprotease [Anaerovoracaceae bacterium]|jgi:RsiW-degrading membrane proteinase PrsW (M82 family)
MDKIEKEPTGLLVRLFLLGALSTVPAIILEQLGTVIFLDGLIGSETSMTAMVVDNFFIVGLSEELCKRFVLRRTTWGHPAFDHCFDAVVYAVVVSLGFAALENIFYVFDTGLGTALLRAVTSIPGHCIFGIYMGHYYGMAKVAAYHADFAKSKSQMHKSLWVPAFLHGFYDFTASSSNDVLLVIFFVYIVVLDIFAIRSVRKYSREDRTLWH